MAYVLPHHFRTCCVSYTQCMKNMAEEYTPADGATPSENAGI